MNSDEVFEKVKEIKIESTNLYNNRNKIETEIKWVRPVIKEAYL